MSKVYCDIFCDGDCNTCKCICSAKQRKNKEKNEDDKKESVD